MGFSLPVAANNFTNADFLKLDDNEKKYWIVASIETLWQIEAHKNKAVSQCIVDWYYKDIAYRNGLIVGYAKKYPKYTPTAVLTIVLKKACGLSIKS